MCCSFPVSIYGYCFSSSEYVRVLFLFQLVFTSIVSLPVSIYGYCWQIGEVGVNSSYIYRNKGHVVGTIGVRMGLQTVNLTLTGILALLWPIIGLISTDYVFGDI